MSTPHVIQCADAWLRDAGKPTYSDLLAALRDIAALPRFDLTPKEAIEIAEAALVGAFVPIENCPNCFHCFKPGASCQPDFGPLYSTRLAAARYRWLRDPASETGYVGADNILRGDKLDATIDEVMRRTNADR
jgi:hypothetical protein